jgi:GntR family transcriptional regulator
MAMEIVLTNTDKPLYLQLFEQISAQIVRGELAQGEVLPPIRTVAKELRISVITVKKAWEELERGGFIVTMAGKGCFVAPRQGELTAKRGEMAEERLREGVAYCKSLGLSQDEVLELVRRFYVG